MGTILAALWLPARIFLWLRRQSAAFGRVELGMARTAALPWPIRIGSA
jgi:hypothetical protein